MLYRNIGACGLVYDIIPNILSYIILHGSAMLTLASIVIFLYIPGVKTIWQLWQGEAKALLAGAALICISLIQ